jgi:hypothetical protein
MGMLALVVVHCWLFCEGINCYTEHGKRVCMQLNNIYACVCRLHFLKLSLFCARHVAPFDLIMAK